ncbi:MAG: CpaD family pilus assembly protein [Proteobacteria bacterium]|nr:CpaD family pilus assembly protein [Pseudomonadota bacterium]
MSNSTIYRASAIFLALLACACTTPSWKSVGPGEHYALRFPITVSPTMRTLRVPFGGYGAGVDANNSVQLQGFIREYMDQGVGAISVSAPEGWEEPARDYAEELVAMGVPRTRIMIGTDPAPRVGAEILVSFVRYVAESPKCGDWSANLGQTSSNAPAPNFGCATQHNIAAMVADPRDLVAPGRLGPNDVTRRVAIIDKYREGTPTPAEKTAEQSAAVSQVGAN